MKIAQEEIFGPVQVLIPFEDEAEAFELSPRRDQAVGIDRVELDHLGQQQRLTRHPAIRHRASHPFEHETLVRGVLIDQNQPVVGLCDDIGARHLPARDPEREVGRFGRGRRDGERRAA